MRPDYGPSPLREAFKYWRVARDLWGPRSREIRVRIPTLKDAHNASTFGSFILYARLSRLEQRMAPMRKDN